MIEVTPQFAEQFLRGGGQLSLVEWLGLTEEGQRAFVDAGDRIRRGQVADMVEGLAGGLEDAVVDAALTRAVARAAERLEVPS